MTAPAALRPATVDDVATLYGIECLAFDNPGEVFTPRVIRTLIRNPRALVEVALWNGGVNGWSAWLLRKTAGGAVGRLYALAVHQRARGQGLGRLLVESGLAEMRRRGAARIFLEVRSDNPARHLYEKLAFVVRHEKRDYYGDGLHAVSMVRDPA